MIYWHSHTKFWEKRGSGGPPLLLSKVIKKIYRMITAQYVISRPSVTQKHTMHSDYKRYISCLTNESLNIQNKRRENIALL